MDNRAPDKTDQKADVRKVETYADLNPFKGIRATDRAPPWLRALAPLVIEIWPIYLVAAIGMALLLVVQFGYALVTFDDGADVRNIGLIIAGAIGLPFLVWRTMNLQRQTNIAQESHYTDLFTKAIEQLGAGKRSKRFMVFDEEKGKEVPGKDQWGREIVPSDEGLELRLGAIYALERIARESRKDHWPIMEVLCAFIRSNPVKAVTEGRPDAPAKIQHHEEEEFRQWVGKLPHPSLDVQAALDVIGRRSVTQMKWENEDRKTGGNRTINLRGSNLQRVVMTGSELDFADFYGSNCVGANFLFAHLNEARFEWCDCAGAAFLDVKYDRIYTTRSSFQFALGDLAD